MGKENNLNNSFIEILDEFNLYKGLIENFLNKSFLAIDIKDKNNKRVDKSIIYLKIDTNIKNVKLMLSDTNILIPLDKFGLLKKIKNIFQIPTICMVREFFWNKYKLGLFKNTLISNNYYQDNLENNKNEKIIFMENIFKYMELHLKNKDNKNNFDYQKLENSIDFKQLEIYFKEFFNNRNENDINFYISNFKKFLNLDNNLKIKKQELYKYGIEIFKLMLKDIQNYQKDFNYIDIVKNQKWQDISKLNKEYFKIPFNNLTIFNINNPKKGNKPKLSDIDIILMNYILNIYFNNNKNINNINNKKNIVGTNDENIIIALKTKNINFAQELMALSLAKNKKIINQKEIDKFIKSISEYKIKEKNEIEKFNTKENFIKLENLIKFIINFKKIKNLLNKINKNNNLNLFNSINNFDINNLNKIQQNIINFVKLCRNNFNLEFNNFKFNNFHSCYIYNNKSNDINNKNKIKIFKLVQDLYISSELIRGDKELENLKKYIYKVDNKYFHLNISKDYIKYLKEKYSKKFNSIFNIKEKNNKTFIAVKR